LRAWPLVQEGRENPLASYLAEDLRIRAFMQPREVMELMDAKGYVGDAPARTRMIIAHIRDALRT
jgi:hypothetical protein